MPRRCGAQGCTRRPIYGFPCSWKYNIAKNKMHSCDLLRENPWNTDVVVKREMDKRGYGPLDKCKNEKFMPEYPIDEKPFQQKTVYPNTVVEQAQSSSIVPCFDTGANFMDTFLPPSTPMLVQSASSSTISSVSSCTTCGSRPPSPTPLEGSTRTTQVSSAQTVYCKLHKELGMIDVVSRRCEWGGGCIKRPLYGFPGERPAVCAGHRTLGMVDRKSRRCAISNCNTVPSYAYPGEKAEFCLKHASQGMINVVSSQCVVHRCRTRASFAMRRGDRAIVCAAHKGNSMIDVRSRQCLHMGCKRQPSFAEAGSRPEYCSSHKKDGMVDVKNRGSKKLHSFQLEQVEHQQQIEALRRYQKDVTQVDVEKYLWNGLFHNEEHVITGGVDIMGDINPVDQNSTYNSVVPEIMHPDSVSNVKRSYGILRSIKPCVFDQDNASSNGIVHQTKQNQEFVKYSSSPTKVLGGTLCQHQKIPSDLPNVTNLLPSPDNPPIMLGNWGEDNGPVNQDNFPQLCDKAGSPPFLLSPTLLSPIGCGNGVNTATPSIFVSPDTKQQHPDRKFFHIDIEPVCTSHEPIHSPQSL